MMIYKSFNGLERLEVLLTSQVKVFVGNKNNIYQLFEVQS